MYRIDVTLRAAEQIGRVVGLRRRIVERLAGLGEVTDQLLILQGGFFPGPSLLRDAVEGWLVHYDLDPGQRRITVLSVERGGAARHRRCG
jgi:hypothetical protein